ncbi:Possible alpha/beta hydrolase superfamily, slr1235 homolog [[Actinomadura] parvosata subsp. kistnae]|uniref:AB hydrolase-1 domain-containing protein n=1 Tax=[Actinomadura] parvosata subsp. kistnae TaxID=1909395 RepID=A0A1U9ZZA1_9ACTN|nr:alpha/beta hydrolase [Nonomuraea sp. ATCC 55076]AQZ63272.1 hypothetical protein BKM31_19005 [Nonomuraea sp. ATCC 55076]SPL98960.1 Possible alpha/beta hydrolase superfamily, slr1235 homolog [Actinomadura parvosata subsp. kistnae]
MAVLWADPGDRVHYLDFGGPHDGPVVVAVHGLSGSALNWLAIAPLLTGRCRLLAPDLAGHGLTRARERRSGAAADRLLLHRFVERVAGVPVILMGNSMGGMISLLEAAANPDAVAGLVLLDVAGPFGRALPDPMVAAVFALYGMPWLGTLAMARHRAMPARTSCGRPDRSCGRRPGCRTGLSYRAASRSVRVPALLVHGERDRLVPVAASRTLARAHPSWRLIVLDGVGHTPQLEAPQETADAVLRRLDGESQAVQAARHRFARQA